MLAASEQSWRLENLFLENRFCRVAHALVAWIRRTERDEEADVILRMLTYFTHVPNSASNLESFSNDLVQLMKNILALEAGVELAQDLYFDGYPILFRNIEDTLKTSIEFITSTVERFSEFFSMYERAHIRAAQMKPGFIDVEAIMNDARAKASLDMLGVRGAYRWEIFRAQREEELRAALDVSRATRHKQRSAR